MDEGRSGPSNPVAGKKHIALHEQEERDDFARFFNHALATLPLCHDFWHATMFDGN